MNLDTIYKTITSSPEDTLALGVRVGKLLQGGEVVELVSDLGGGKTTCVKGIAQGLGVTAEVTSPSFTINRVYKLENGHRFYHFDFYRLGEGDIVAAELEEVMGKPDTIIAIEWAENTGEILPQERLVITFALIDPHRRQIIIEAKGKNYLHVIQGLNQDGSGA